MLFDLRLKGTEIKAEIVVSIVHCKIGEFLQDDLLKILYLNTFRLLLPLAVLLKSIGTSETGVRFGGFLRILKMFPFSF